MVVVYFCQGMLLKIAPEYPMDSGENLYNVMSFEKAEASILGGVGVPWLMRHEQAMLNSAVRLLIDNGALGSLPQLVVDETQIEPENIWASAESRCRSFEPPTQTPPSPFRERD